MVTDWLWVENLGDAWGYALVQKWALKLGAGKEWRLVPKLKGMQLDWKMVKQMDKVLAQQLVFQTAH
jgi:hypothetical protein